MESRGKKEERQGTEAEVSGYPVKVIGTEVVDGLKFPEPCPAPAPKTGFLPFF